MTGTIKAPRSPLLPTRVQGSVLRVVLQKGLVHPAGGIILGLAAAAARSHLLTSMLFEVKATDPFTYGAVVMLLTVVTLAASYVPARPRCNNRSHAS
jgi:hypothetical protein